MVVLSVSAALVLAGLKLWAQQALLCMSLLSARIASREGDRWRGRC